MSKLHSLYFLAIGAIVFVLASIGSSGAAPDGEVKAAYAAWDAAFKKGDAKAISAFYAEDALFLPANHKVIKGRDAVEKFFAEMLGGGATNHKLDMIEAGGNGKLLYGSAKWTADGKDSAGKHQPWGGNASHVFEKGADGKLKIKLHTFN
jgi:ketosteroid isomerase-like protein